MSWTIDLEEWIRRHWKPNLFYRMKKEIEELAPFGEIEFRASDSRFTITTKRGHKINMIVPPEYPFCPPIVKIGKTPFDHWRQDSSVSNNLYSQKYKGRCPCTCCRSILTSGRWGPCRTLRSVINQVLEEEEYWFNLFSEVVLQVIPKTIPIDISEKIAEFL